MHCYVLINEDQCCSILDVTVHETLLSAKIYARSIVGVRHSDSLYDPNSRIEKWSEAVESQYAQYWTEGFLCLYYKPLLALIAKREG